MDSLKIIFLKKELISLTGLWPWFDPEFGERGQVLQSHVSRDGSVFLQNGAVPVSPENEKKSVKRTFLAANLAVAVLIHKGRNSDKSL